MTFTTLTKEFTMRTNLNKGKSFFAPALAVSIVLALALTLTGCAEDPANDSGGGGDNSGGGSQNGGGFPYHKR
ncbi:MAG: hypothetical protein LBH25_11800 [Fibromonadaceae bacterium]|jgi:hypothetical protein|nr:hypothetical protein [Fibromonadaceae bacterium]